MLVAQLCYDKCLDDPPAIKGLLGIQFVERHPRMFFIDPILFFNDNIVRTVQKSFSIPPNSVVCYTAPISPCKVTRKNYLALPKLEEVVLHPVWLVYEILIHPPQIQTVG